LGSQNFEAAKLRTPKTPFSLVIELPQRVSDFKSFAIQTLEFHMHARANNYACRETLHCFPETINVFIYMKPTPAAECYYHASMKFTTEARTFIMATGLYHSAIGHADRSGTTEEHYCGPYYFERSAWKQDEADIVRIDKLWQDE
jgi:hypothetical protein